MKRLALLACPFALLAAHGCGSSVQVSTNVTTSSASTSATSTSSSSSSSGTGTGGSGGAQPADVTGTVVNRYYGEGAPVDQPEDLFGSQVEALVLEGGSWKVFPGSGKNDGSFTIPGVPPGMFMLDVAGTYLYTSARALDLGSDIAGRSDAVFAMQGPTIAGAVQNLLPWNANDQIEWFDANADGAGYDFANTAPAAGDTSLTMNEPSSWLGALVDASKGDVLYLTQLTQQQQAGADYYTVSRFASFQGVQQQDGALTTVLGSLSPVSVTQKVAVDFRASEFAAQATAVNPMGKGFGAAFDLAGVPGAAAKGVLGYTFDLLLVYPDESDVNLGTVQYADPFPPAWGETVYAGESWGVSVTAPGATMPTTQYGTIYVVMPPAMASAGPIRPLVTPVLAPQVDGKSAFGALDGISTTPTLSWSAPAKGQPTAYHVTVYQLVAGGGASQAQYTAEVVTTGTSVTMPPGVLTSGSAYVFQITAVVSSVDAGSAPFRSAPAYASADVVTGVALPK